MSSEVYIPILALIVGQLLLMLLTFLNQYLENRRRRKERVWEAKQKEKQRVHEEQEARLQTRRDSYRKALEAINRAMTEIRNVENAPSLGGVYNVNPDVMSEFRTALALAAGTTEDEGLGSSLFEGTKLLDQGFVPNTADMSISFNESEDRNRALTDLYFLQRELIGAYGSIGK